MSSESDLDFLTYLLLFATHADFHFDEEERDHILSKVDQSTFERVNRIFQMQNDIQRIDRIRAYLKAGNYSESQLEGLVAEVGNAFYADGDYSTLEQNLMIGLKRILKS
ncbi:MAG: uncharacterized membrane protein YebE (DUF533 family) [Cryomorphaceae bacterium]|jgi:uncharacterized membrane protein YebE (DUF533 family)